MICKICNISFEKPDKTRQTKTCSKECSIINAKRNKNAWRTRGKTKNNNYYKSCEICDVLFRAKGNTKTCSKKCSSMLSSTKLIHIDEIIDIIPAKLYLCNNLKCKIYSTNYFYCPTHRERLENACGGGLEGIGVGGHEWHFEEKLVGK